MFYETKPHILHLPIIFISRRYPSTGAVTELAYLKEYNKMQTSMPLKAHIIKSSELTVT